MFIRKRKKGEEILAAIREDNNVDEAINALYKNYYEKVVRRIINYNGTRQDAEDVIQDSTVLLIKMVRDGTFEDKASIFTFFFAICLNQWRSNLKLKDYQSKSDVTDLSDDVTLSEEDQNLIDLEIERHKRWKLLEEIFDSLGKNCKDILIEYYYHAKKPKEMKGRLELMSPKAILNQKNRCLEKLAARMKVDENLEQLVKELLT